MAVVSEKQAEEGKCSCFIIHSERGVSPENLLCHAKGAKGYLSDEDEKEFCFGGNWDDIGERVRSMDISEFNEALEAGEFEDITMYPIEDTPEGYEEHMEKMKYDVGPTWKECMGIEDKKDFWSCISDEAERASELYDMNNEELREQGEDMGLTGLSRLNKQQLVSKIRSSS